MKQKQEQEGTGREASALKEVFAYRHGGERRGMEVELDFSVNINPFGMPEEVRTVLFDPRSAAAYERYPDADCTALRALLSEKEKVETERIVCGNGASELLDAAVRAFGGGKGMLLSPCFIEYEASFAKAGIPVVWSDRRRETGFSLPEDFLERLEREKPSLTILTNPGNPMGELLPRKWIGEALDRAASFGGRVLVDECFMDFCSEKERCCAAALYKKHPNLLILKAFTKTYAMAGLRLGYLVLPDAGEAGRVKRQLSAWNVSAPALLAGRAALLGGDGYLRRTVCYLKRERARVAKELQRRGCLVYPGAADYLFFEADAGLYERLLTEKLLIRQCGNYRGLGREYYRMALKLPEENDRLLSLIGGK